MNILFKVFIACFCWFGLIRCDLPTNCMYPEVVGKWLFHLDAGNNSYGYQCNDHEVKPVDTLTVNLLFPNVAVDEHGNEGTWTMVYNQGFEVIIGGRRFFAFLIYKQISKDVAVSICNATFNGWFHDNVDIQKPSFPVKNWGCYFGHKPEEGNVLHSEPKLTILRELPKSIGDKRYGLKEDFVERINNHQSHWRATVYPQFQNKTIAEMVRMAGGRRNVPVAVRPSEVTREMLEMAKDLPESFDWRNKDGKNYVTPIRNQGECGSCYSFASMACLESGVAIATNGRMKPVFSPQYIVSCSNYSQGCDGGFAYLTAGRFAQDYGVVLEQDYPYLEHNSTCKDRFVSRDNRVHVSEYGYVGGFYGGCNEVLMRLAIVKHGPIAIGFNVTSDFMNYKGGIYTASGLNADLGYNPFELTNHAVLIVGYGVDHDSGMNYWIVKNSWGATWGEDGYFRIRRGTDELGIESTAMYAKPYMGH